MRWIQVKTGEESIPVTNSTSLGGGMSIDNTVHQTKLVSTYKTTLNQKWVDNLGNSEWREIPTVVEVNND